jgi:hypothetical protein
MFIGNSHNYLKLVSWMQNPIILTDKLSYKHICIVIGDAGVGKSYGIESAANDSSIILYRLNNLDCNNSKDFRDLLYKITSSNIISQFDNQEKTQKIIWLDDFDSYIIFDRTFLHTLQDILDTQTIPAIKIVISTTSADIKHYTKFYNMGLILKLKIPDSSDILVVLRKKFQNLPVKVINHISDVSNGNLSYAIHLANIESYTYSNKKIAKDICTFISTQSNDKFPKLVDLYNQKYDINDGRVIFHQDPWLNPLRFHENILYEFKQRNDPSNNINSIYIKILRLFCDWDQIMAYNKITNGNGMNIAIEMISYVPYYLESFPKKQNAESSMNEFTRMFNYLSLKKKNAVALYIPEFPWITIGSYYKHLYDDKNKKIQKSKKFST